MVSTVGSNLRDCAPLASLHRVDLSPAKTTEWDSFYRAGMTRENEGKHAEAALQYQRAAQLDDQFAELQFRLARCCAALDQREEALRHFVLARDLDALRFRADGRINEIIRRVAGQWQPRGVRLADAESVLARESADGTPGAGWFYEHVRLTFAGNYLVARQIAEQVVQCIPTATPGLAGDGARPFLSPEECARRLGLTDWDRLQMAEEMLRRTSRPPFTNQLDHAADAARRQKIVSELRERDRTNFQSSAAIYQQALTRAAGDWQLHDDFAGALLQHGDRTNAIEHWRRVTQLLPHRIQTYDLLGSILLEQGKLDEAETCYQQALRIQPDFVEGLIGLGRVWLGQKREAEAIGQFRRAVKLQPQSGRTHNHLGVALLHFGKNVEAEKAFRDALRVEPDFVPAGLNLGSALLAQGKADAAIANYQELVRSDPRNIAARTALGKVLAKQKRMEEAIQQYTEAVRQQPDNFDLRYTLGSALIHVNRLAEAADDFAIAIRLRPDSFESHLNYGSILARQGESAGARAEFEEAVRLKPDLAPAHLNLAVALMEENQFSQAIAHLREVLRLEPGNARARQMLETSLARQKSGQ